MNKSEIRKQYLQRRMDLEEEVFIRLSDRIVEDFARILFPPPDWLMSFRPFAPRREFPVHRCEEVLRKEFPGLQVALPQIVAGTAEMEALHVTPQTPFQTNRFGMEEPAEGERVAPDRMDLVFVPLLAFDRSGYRVGYGKGFYDRYLARCRKDVLKIGFSLFPPLERIGDIDEFDVPLNYCITPNGVYEF